MCLMEDSIPDVQPPTASGDARPGPVWQPEFVALAYDSIHLRLIEAIPEFEPSLANTLRTTTASFSHTFCSAT